MTSISPFLSESSSIYFGDLLDDKFNELSDPKAPTPCDDKILENKFHSEKIKSVIKSWMNLAKERCQVVFAKDPVFPLQRLIVLPNGIALSVSRQKGYKIKGIHKNFTRALCIASEPDRYYACLTMLQEKTVNLCEIENLSLLSKHKVKGFVKPYFGFSYTNKKKERKWCVIMTLGDQEDLGTFLAKNPTLSYKDKLFITYELVMSLRRLFELGLIHRDIKPANIFITTESDAKSDHERRFIPLIGDVGSICYTEKLKHELAKFQTTLKFGSPEYAEAFLQSLIRTREIGECMLLAKMSPKHDVFSLGLVLSLLWSNHYPFPWMVKGIEVLEICTKIRNFEMPEENLSRIKKNSPHLAGMIQKMLEKNPKIRTDLSCFPTEWSEWQKLYPPPKE